MDAASPHAPPAAFDTVERALSDARIAAADWRRRSLADRARLAARVRRLVGDNATELARSLGDRRPPADTLAAEVLPLAEAAAFLARRAPALLAPERLGRRFRPFWLLGVAAEIRREPCGVVLVLAPSNYPLFLPGAQVLQALVAGNAVCVKPAPGCAAPMQALAALLASAGLPPGVLRLLPDDAATGQAAAQAGFDRIVLTGAATTGRAVLQAAAATLTPATMELSGNDAVFVLPGADLARVADALAFGARLNHGATCIAPRRVFVPRPLAAPLEAALLARLATWPEPAAPPPQIAGRLDTLAADATRQGARRLAPAGRALPVILADADAEMGLLQEDVFAPWLALVPVADPAEALAAAARCPYALGAAIFGPAREALAFAAAVQAGSVCINDLIVPTADPRLPFGGRGRSGFGVTRGAAGLLEMTVIKTVSVRRGGLLRHLAPSGPNGAAELAGLIGLLHGSRLGALRRLMRR
jgi:acyl-CoA reductase-like NAD-dependent aldehyde dehydrogenase